MDKAHIQALVRQARTELDRQPKNTYYITGPAVWDFDAGAEDDTTTIVLHDGACYQGAVDHMVKINGDDGGTISHASDAGHSDTCAWCLR